MDSVRGEQRLVGPPVHRCSHKLIGRFVAPVIPMVQKNLHRQCNCATMHPQTQCAHSALQDQRQPLAKLAFRNASQVPHMSHFFRPFMCNTTVSQLGPTRLWAKQLLLNSVDAVKRLKRGGRGRIWRVTLEGSQRQISKGQQRATYERRMML